MTISKESLLIAILTLDSYNREYDQGIILDPALTQIGTATFHDHKASNVSDSNYLDWIAAGFYAASYDTPYGKVIAYRGTDKNIAFSSLWSNATGSDLWNGYGTSAGFSMNDQAHMAADFFQAVTGTNTSNPSTGSAILTGHSLGGGLAGFIAAIYRQNAYM
jgi:hypothetical protein